MAIFKDDIPDFLSKNIELYTHREHTMYAKFLDKKPSFVTYYHINKIESKTDKGLKTVEVINGNRSPIKYNKITKFPIYGIEEIVLQLEDTEYGLDSDYTGEGVILPNTIHPTADDYFTIDYLEKKYTFRVIEYQYDTIHSNSYYKISFTIRGVDIDIYHKIESQVVKTYNCIFDNIGTENKCLIEESVVGELKYISDLIETMKKEYINLFYVGKYNALLFYNTTEEILYDANLAAFCNKNEIFNDSNELDTYLFYEELRDYFPASYSRSIYDRMEHSDIEDIDELDKYFNFEPAVSTTSVFEYWDDMRIKYIIYYNGPESMFKDNNSPYLDLELIDALKKNDSSIITKNLSLIVYTYLTSGSGDYLLSVIKNVIKSNHYRYTFYNYIFIPLVVYCLRQLYKTLSSYEENPYYTDSFVEYNPENV